MTASAGTTERVRPRASARITTAPMAPARSTLGDGRARTTKPTRASRARTATVRGPSRPSRARSRTDPSTKATFDPLTARRCVRPAVRKSRSRSAPIREVSPTTSPGNSAAGSSPSTARDASRRPARRSPAASWRPGGGPTSRGGPRVRRTATVRSPRVEGPRVPLAVARCPGSRPAHPAAGASSTTRPSPRHRAPAAWAAASSARTTTRGSPARPVLRSGVGSSVRTTSRVAADPASAAARSGCPATWWAAVLATPPTAPAQIPVASSPAAQRGADVPARRTACSRRPPSVAATSASTVSSTPGPHPRASGTRAAAHAASAGGTRRASTAGRGPGSERSRPPVLTPAPGRAGCRTGRRRSRGSPAAARPPRTGRSGCASRGSSSR